MIHVTTIVSFSLTRRYVLHRPRLGPHSDGFIFDGNNPDEITIIPHLRQYSTIILLTLVSR